MDSPMESEVENTVEKMDLAVADMNVDIYLADIRHPLEPFNLGQCYKLPGGKIETPHAK